MTLGDLMTTREAELLEKIEGLRVELESANALYTEALAEIQRLREQQKLLSNATFRRLVRERDVAEDRLRAAQSQGAV